MVIEIVDTQENVDKLMPFLDLVIKKRAVAMLEAVRAKEYRQSYTINKSI